MCECFILSVSGSTAETTPSQESNLFLSATPTPAPQMTPTTMTGSSDEPLPEDVGDSNYWTWGLVVFIAILVIAVVVYIVYHNKQKVR